jgi:hypothetical protein
MASEHEPWDKRIASHIDEIHGEIHGKVTGAGNTDRQCFLPLVWMCQSCELRSSSSFSMPMTLCM